MLTFEANASLARDAARGRSPPALAPDDDLVAARLVVIDMLSTLPTPLYVVYRQALGFSKLTLTLIYAASVVGSVGAMFFLGRLSDQVGRRPVVLAVGLFLAALELVLRARHHAAAPGRA